MKKIKEIIEKIGKDRLAILLIGGLLLLVITIPADHTNKNILGTHTDDIKNSNGTNRMDLYDDWDSSAYNNSNTNGICAGDYLKNYEAYTFCLEKRLQNALQNISGAGKVEVLITLQDAGSLVVEKDFSYTRDNQTKKLENGTSETNAGYEDAEETIYTANENGDEIPFITQEILPSIEGILIVAEGGGNAKVKNEMKNAVLSLFDLDEHKIAIVKMKSKTG